MKTERVIGGAPFFIAMLFVALAGPAHSESGPDFARKGGYLGVGFALGINNFDIPSSIDVDAGFGFDAWGGYRFHPYLAAELQVEYLNGFGTDIPGPDVSGQAVTFTGNLKVYILKGRAQPFLLAGAGLGWEEFELDGWKESRTAFAARFGGGFDYYFSENWVLQFSPTYVLQTGDLEGGDYISIILGVQYRF
ncbi:MAG: porin family protein [Deltaproteobacteria bacterium]|nr:porin family protein [Deltaproteobacteria bacterium]MBW2398330.1 porin family protein [Deltaproteobacteria bacterium]